MTHQNLRLGKCWKLFWATLSSAVFKICDQRSVNVSSNAVCKCQIPHKYGHGEMRNKKLTNRRNDITQGWQFCSPPWKRKGKKRKKCYYKTGYSYSVTHPSRNCDEWGLTLLGGRNISLSLWYSHSTLNAFF